MVRSGDHLNVRFDPFAGAPQRGTFSAPDLVAIDIPLQHVKLGSVIHWELVGDNTLVPVQSSIQQTVALLKQHGNTDVTVRVFDDADHALHVPSRSPDDWPHLPSGFPDAITSLCLVVFAVNS